MDDLELNAWRCFGHGPDLQAALDELAPSLQARCQARGAALIGAAPLDRLALVAAQGSLAPGGPWDRAPSPAAFAALAPAVLCHGPDLPPALLEGLPPPLAQVLGILPVREGPVLWGLLALDLPLPPADPHGLAGALLGPVSAALHTAARMRELSRLRERLEADRQALLSRLERQDIADAVVGADGGLKTVLRRVDQVAATDAPVLLRGETGTGKEVVARLLHARSGRAAGPMVKVNCGAIPTELVDSELFGHERGSFTGAHRAHRGWFERADGGTLFLDEVAELPPAAQVRLLRVLQDGTLVRVGGQGPVRVDVRVVAATHADLGALVAAGRFRQDLWFRLAVFPIDLPPLRERPEDLPALAEHFAHQAGRRIGGQGLSPSPGDLARLLAYPWPGNVRELAAVIERAVILGDGRRLEIALALGGQQASPALAAVGEERPVPLEEAIRAHIERVLDHTGGRIEGAGGAAALLGEHPATLRSRMRRLGIDWGRWRAGGSNRRA